MTALRQLSAIYLAAASMFVVAMAFEEHPVLRQDASATAGFVRIYGTKAAIFASDDIIQPGWRFARDESAVLDRKIAETLNPPQHVAQNAPVRVHAARHPEIRVAKHEPPRAPAIQAPKAAPVPQVAMTAPPPVVEAPKAETPTQPQQSAEVASNLPAQPKPMILAPEATAPVAPPPQDATPETASPVPNLPAPSPAELVRVEQRLKDNLTSEMLQNFELFLYVSKADTGPWAQRMYVFQKQASGDLVMLYNWPVSTGREKIEFNAAGAKLPSFTPQGYYELDPKRFYPHYRSVQWNQPMPYAMFFNWVKDGNQTGLAIHAASGDDIGLLGTRASAGCVRLAPDSARLLFNLIRTQYKGLAPRFAYDRRTGTMSNEGILLHDPDGHVQLADGYKVLVVIENNGGENVVAALF